MNVILYARVSTSDQTCEPQLVELRNLCAARKWTIMQEFTDTISGTKADRVGLDAALELVRAKKVDALCAVKIDRMARSLAHFSKLAAEFVKYDVALICPGQGIDTSKSNPCGKFQMNILAAVAEFERDLISERTKAGMAVARANGKQIGMKSTVLPATDEERKKIVAEWLRGGDNSYEKLGEMLGGVPRSTAWRIAKKFNLTWPAIAPEIDVEV